MRGLYCAFFFLLAHTVAGQVSVDYSPEVPGIDLAVSKIKEALIETGHRVHLPGSSGNAAYSINLRIRHDRPAIKAEGYEVETRGNTISIYAAEASGLRYGALALAEQLLIEKDPGKIRPGLTTPAFEVRAIKFNLPWEPYRESRSMDYHLSTCRDLNFWEDYLDMMFVNRFNLLALYNMHPFPYMVRLEDYPEASPFTEEQMEEWKAFWKGLFKMARERGIEVFIVNWNIVVPASFAEKHDVNVLNDTASVIADYTRKSVTAIIDEYEDLGGIGVTLADWMENMTPARREDWIDETFVAGIRAAKRSVKFLHRSVLSGSSGEMRRIINKADLPDPVLVEVKFNWSHGHSTPQLFITHASSSGQINTGFWEPVPENYKIQWMIRNEDFWTLRWGEPGFIRDHIRTNTKPYVNGYYIGSEGYIPAFEYFTKAEVGRTWQYAFERQWLFYSLWGRLLYDAGTSDAVFAAMFNRKYRFSQGREMLRAYKLVSRMPLRLASFFAATWDYTLYAEGFLAPVIPRGYGHDDGQSLFISIDELIDHKVLDPSYVSIKDYVQMTKEKKVIPEHRITPAELADELTSNADSAAALLVALRKHANPFSNEYTQELDDINVWALMSYYFADKLRAGVALQTFRETGNTKSKEEAVALLKKCVEHWKQLSAITSRNYYEVPYFKQSRNEDRDADYFSWAKYLREVERDVKVAEGQ